MTERRNLLWVLTAVGVAVGAWAQFAPASFFADFPFGRGWVPVGGAYNEHLVRDVGGLNLALAALSAAAALRADALLTRVAALAWLVYGVPHLAYHGLHLAGLPAVDAVGQMVSLAVGVLIPLRLLWRSRSRAAGGAAR